jgi:uncharacterized Tic20 family protein
MSEEFPERGSAGQPYGQRPAQPYGQPSVQPPAAQPYGPGVTQSAPSQPYGEQTAQPGQPYGQGWSQPPGQSYGQPYGQQPGTPGQPGPGGGLPGYQPPMQSVPADGGPQGYGPRGPSDDHMWALFAYLSPILFSFLGPLIIYLVKMNESKYVRYHAAQALNLIITSTIYWIGVFIVGILLAIVTHGLGLLLLPLYFVFGAITLVYLIMAAIAANRGELYKIPNWLCLKIVH